MISNSGRDERNKYSGGVAGDNTGTEWQLRSWYNRPWKCVLRYPDSKVAKKISDLSIKAAKNNKIGYDQGQRNTYWQQLQAVGYDPSKIKTPCESDCSAGVIANIKAAGHLLGITALQNINATYTGNLRSGAKKAGFIVLTESKYLTGETYLKPGDILLNDAHHVAVYVGNGSISGETTVTTSQQSISSNEIKAKGTADYFNKSLSGTYKTTANLNMRDDAGVSNKSLVVIPKDTKVKCYGYYSLSKGVNWLYVEAKIKNVKYTGFCSKAYLKK